MPRHMLPDSKGQNRASDGRRFVSWDRSLDQANVGPNWLGDPRVTAIIERAIEQGQTVSHLYSLEAYVVMPNHVHILINPHEPLAKITQHVKGTTAREANSLLRRLGQQFWQDESFDRWVRDEAERERLRLYIEDNPVKANLVKSPGDWPWSSAAKAKATG